jgi:hypothetical protein
MSRVNAVLLVLAVTLVASQNAQGYAMRIHQELTSRALGQDAWLLRQNTIQGVTVNQLNQFRQWFYTQLSRHLTSELKTRFQKRYPTAGSFDALSFREFLSLNTSPRRRIFGIDRIEARQSITARQFLARSSSDPDSDGRNLERMVYDRRTGKPHLIDGQPIPFDPSTLNMGRLKGLSSQAHAHYGLPTTFEFSDDPDVLKEDPKRFLIKTGFPDGPVLALAADMSQMHTDLAILAHFWGGPKARYLTLAFVGHAFHYTEDVGNQIHTVQVGSFGFFLDAKLQYWWRALITAGGYLTSLKPFTAVGVAILSNHHIMIEQLTRLRFEEALAGRSSSPAMTDAVKQLNLDDIEFSKQLDLALEGAEAGTFAKVITQAIIEQSAPEGPKAYELMRDVGCGRISRYGFKVPDDNDREKMDMDSLLCLDGDEEEAKLESLYELQATAFRRVTTALRRYDRELSKYLLNNPAQSAIAPLLNRFTQARLDLLDAAEKRRAKYMENPPKQNAPTIKEAGWLFGELIVLLLIAALIWWRTRRKEETTTATT